METSAGVNVVSQRIPHVNTRPGFSVELPFSVYAVPVGQGHISLAQNSQARSVGLRRYLLKAAREKVRHDMNALMLAATWPAMKPPLTLNVTVRNAERRTRDDDGCWAAVKVARDVIAEHLGINDSEIRCGTVEFEVGLRERAVLEIVERSHDPA